MSYGIRDADLTIILKKALPSHALTLTLYYTHLVKTVSLKKHVLQNRSKCGTLSEDVGEGHRG